MLRSRAWHTLANACALAKWHGAVAACSLVQEADFLVSVMPFRFRAVTLYGINCIFVRNEQRIEAWRLLADHVSPTLLASMSHDICLSDAIAAAASLLEGRLPGRAVVDVNCRAGFSTADGFGWGCLIRRCAPISANRGQQTAWCRCACSAGIALLQYASLRHVRVQSVFNQRVPASQPQRAATSVRPAH